MKSPTPLTLRIPKDQLLSTKRSPPPSSTPVEAGKQHKAKVLAYCMNQLCISGLVFKDEKEGGWERERGKEGYLNLKGYLTTLPMTQAVTPTSSELSTPGSKSGSSGRAALHVKVTRSKAWLAEYTQSVDPVKIYLAAVYDYHSASGEFVSEVFHELPSAKV